MDYTSKTQVQDYMQTDIDATLNDRVAQYVTAMSEYADEIAGYPIYRENETERKYDGNGETALVIDPVHTITEVTVGDVEVEPLKWPYNDETKTELKLQAGYFTRGLANVTVTGIHALEETLPEKVAWAVTVLVAGIVNQLKNQDEGVQSEKIGQYQVTYTDKAQRNDFLMAKDILERYRPIAF